MTNRPMTTVTMFAAAEGDNEYAKLLAENARLRRHRDLLRSAVVGGLERFWLEVQEQSERSLGRNGLCWLEQSPRVEAAVAAMIETDPERDAEEHKPVTTEVAALCAAEAFRGAQEECQRLRRVAEFIDTMEREATK